MPQVKVKDEEDVTDEMVANTLRRAINYHSTLQAHDGHWSGDYGGPMFLLPGLVGANLLAVPLIFPAQVSSLDYVYVVYGN